MNILCCFITAEKVQEVPIQRQKRMKDDEKRKTEQDKKIEKIVIEVMKVNE